MALGQSLVRVTGVRPAPVVRELKALDPEAAISATVVGRAGGRHAPDRVVELFSRVLDLNLGGAHVGKTEAVRPPGRLRHDLVCHQAFEHAAGVRRHEGESGAGVDIVTFPDVELLARLRIGVRLPGAGYGPLSLPRKVGISAQAVGIRSRWWKCPPAAPPYVARHLVQPHADVGRDTGIAVEGAVVVVVRPVVTLAGGQADVVP